MSWLFMTSTVVRIWDLESQKIATHARCMNTTVSGQPVEKDSFKRIALKMIPCYLQKIQLWDCL